MKVKQMKRHVHVYYVQVISLGPRTPNQVSRFGICDPHPPYANANPNQT